MIEPINADLIQNSIEQIKTICLAIMDDLEYYRKRPNPNKAYIDIHQKRIDTLFDVCQMFTNVYNEVEENIIAVNIYKAQVNDALFAREACAFFHGVSHWEMQFFLKAGISEIHRQIDDCIKTGYRQIPFAFQDIVDEQKRQQTFDLLKIEVSNTGEVSYIRPNPPPVRTATTTTFDWKRSFELLKQQNSQKTEPGTNGKDQKTE